VASSVASPIPLLVEGGLASLCASFLVSANGLETQPRPPAFSPRVDASPLRVGTLLYFPFPLCLRELQTPVLLSPSKSLVFSQVSLLFVGFFRLTYPSTSPRPRQLAKTL